MDLQTSVDRVERELVRLGEHGLDTQTWCRAADALSGRLVGFDGSCWHTIDPATVLITSHLTLNLPSGFPLLAANEYLADDVNKFADLAAAPQPVGVLSQATDGQPQRSLPWQEMLRPNGFDAELRVAFVDSAGCWGSLILVRDRGRPRPRSRDPGCRRAVGRQAGRWPAPNGGRPADHLRAAGPGSRAGGPGPSRPGRVADLGRPPLARRAWGGPAGAVGGGRLGTGQRGRRGPGSAPRPASGWCCTAPGSTATRQIARALQISPYTVQEHLTSIFDKVGVRSRGELVGQVFFRHCLPAIPE
jgi:hypothetical protein